MCRTLSPTFVNITISYNDAHWLVQSIYDRAYWKPASPCLNMKLKEKTKRISIPGPKSMLNQIEAM